MRPTPLRVQSGFLNAIGDDSYLGKIRREIVDSIANRALAVIVIPDYHLMTLEQETRNSLWALLGVAPTFLRSWKKGERATKDESYLSSSLHSVQEPLCVGWVVFLTTCQPQHRNSQIAYLATKVLKSKYFSSVRICLLWVSYTLLATSQSQITPISRRMKINFTSSWWGYRVLEDHMGYGTQLQPSLEDCLFTHVSTVARLRIVTVWLTHSLAFLW